MYKQANLTVALNVLQDRCMDSDMEDSLLDLNYSDVKPDWSDLFSAPDGDLNLDLDLFQEKAVKLSEWFIKYTLCRLFLIFCCFFFLVSMLQNTTKHTKNIHTKYFTNIYCKPIYQHISVVKTYVIMFRLLFEGIFIMLMGFSTLSGDSSPLGLGGSGKLSP